MVGHRRHDSQDQQRRRGRVGRLHDAVDGDRPVVYRERLEDQVGGCDQNVADAEEQQVVIDCKEAPAPDELRGAHGLEAKTISYRHEAEPVGDRVEEHVHACQAVEPYVECRESDARAVLPDQLHVHELHQRRSEHECGERRRPCNEVPPRFCHLFRCDSPLRRWIHGKTKVPAMGPPGKSRAVTSAARPVSSLSRWGLRYLRLGLTAMVLR